ncbi:26S proteasome regulatory complex, non-ATPase subcomplex, Rpn1 subunit [Hesseltinella vesiculosa]|uniref:26S proteasome regulatory subunit RPN1 n=1 Tax=Hesseltinella vesiculosa TaxID=101127 RepID=A0A1X2GH36_9FUNG|nr:26S proteasome regulatory complex, non-ATPase subcomplex, Rpn1 subunit [Hesseltinella vesiculosa]
MVDEKKDIPKEPVDNKPTNEKKDKKEQEEELSEEDQQLKNELELLVDRVQGPQNDLHRPALEQLRTLIRTSTSSMTSVPKPLKFLGPHYDELKATYDTWPASEDKNLFSDVLSVLSMTYSEQGERACLKYRLLGTAEEDFGSWGHEYVRHLAGEIMLEYEHRVDNEEQTDDLMHLAKQIVPFFLKHNGEADAVDLVLELEAVDQLPRFVDKNTYERVCLYMVSCVNLLAPPDDLAFLSTVRTIYRQQEKYAQALTISIRMGDLDAIKEDFESCPDPLLKKQMAFQLARQQIQIETEDVELSECLNNTHLSQYFHSLARELDVMEPKSPEDIYKTSLESNHRTTFSTNVDSARNNLASTFVNAYVNAAFGKDKLMVTEEDETSSSWIYKTKDHGMTSATASLGMISLWNIDVGLTLIDKYMYSDDDNIKAGALLAIGLLNSGVREESDPALALLSEPIEGGNPHVRHAAIFGLGIAYAGSAREEVADLLLPIVSDTSLSMELSSVAALALGMVFVGTCHGDITSTILQTMMEREDKYLKETWSRFMALGLGLLFLGKQDASDATLETLKAIEHPLGKQAEVLVEGLSYIGTGNVLKVQKMLHLCNDHLDKEKEDDTYQAFATIGVALIAMGEDVGSDMSLRTFNHLMHYGEPTIRKAVPLALGLLCASNPQMSVLDTLSKYSHDSDSEVAASAILALGLVGAGTNNARLAQMLRQLASYYYKEPSSLFLVRFAQGLLHMAKGTMTLNPFHTDRQIMSPVAIAGLMTCIITFTDHKPFVFGRWHYLLYSLVTAMYPRFLITFDSELKNLPATVRVGQAVDVVGQAGRPKTITGFQTHSTPVLLAHSERAELATEEYVSLAPVLEGIVLLKKNPDYMEEDTE